MKTISDLQKSNSWKVSGCSSRQGGSGQRCTTEALHLENVKKDEHIDILKERRESWGRVHSVLYVAFGFFKKAYVFNAYEYFACVNVCVPRASSLVPVEVRRQHQSYWNWSEG